MLKRNTKRIFAMLLAVALVFGSVSVPTVAYAADDVYPEISGVTVSKNAMTNADRTVEVTVNGTALPETLYYRLYRVDPVGGYDVTVVDNTAVTGEGTDTTRTFTVKIPENTSGQDEKWKVGVNYLNNPNGFKKSSVITLSANGGSETPDPVEPGKPDTFDNKVLKVKVVDESGKAVAGVALYLESANFAGRGDVAFERVTDTNGMASYTCDSNDMLDNTYYLQTTSDSGYTCEPIEVYVEENDDGDLAVSEIDGEAYTGEVTLTVKKEAAKVDKSKLEAAINAYVDKESCTDASYQVYAAALAEAKAVNEDTNATQEEVDAATTKLTKARNALVYLNLQATIDKNELPRKGGTVTITANGVLNEKVWWVLQLGKSNSMGLTYTTVGNEVNETAVVDGKATIAVEIPENTTGEEVTYRVRVSASEPKVYAGSYSWSSPKSFMIKVAAEDVEAVDKTALAAAIEKEDNSYKNEGAFLSSTWEAYKTALAAAKTVNAKENATQEEVNTALKNLNAAVSGLTYLSLDKVTVTPESLPSAGGTVTVKAEGILNAKVWWKLEKKSADGSYETEGKTVNEAVLSADKTFIIELPANTAETDAEYRIQVKESEPSPWMWGATQKATFTVAGKSVIPEEITYVSATGSTLNYEGGSIDVTVIGTGLKAEDLEVTGTPAVTVKNLTGTDTELKFTVEFPANTAISAINYAVSVKLKGQEKDAATIPVMVKGVNTISGKDALEHSSYILDVRAEDKIAVTGKIPGSQTCPQFPIGDASLDEKMQAFAERYKENTDPIYIMCNSGFVGAPRATKNLLAAGIAPSRIFTIVGGASDEDIRTALVKVGWNQTEDGWTYRNEDGSYISGGWRAIDGSWYYFDAEGYRTEGWKAIGGTWYYFDKATGIMAENGFYDIDGATYYFKAGGAMAISWQVIDGADYFFTGSGAMAKNQWSGSYYLGEDGKMLTNAWAGVYHVGANGIYQNGWLKLDEGWYYLGTNGVVQTGWIQVGNNWYYGQPDSENPGLLVENKFYDINGATYYFKEGGYMAISWQVIDGADYFFTGSGAMAKNQWSGSYYLGADGKMMTNAWVDFYYVGANGVYQNGWLKLDEGWYYLGTNGVLQFGWFQVGNTWYFGDTDPDEGSVGIILESTLVEIDGVTYFFKEGGAMAIGWVLLDGAYSYFNGSGAMVTSAWVGNYYLNEDGVMARNEWVDGGRYYVGDDGLWIPNAQK